MEPWEDGSEMLKTPQALYRQMKPDILKALETHSGIAEIQECVGYGTKKRVTMALVELEWEGKVYSSGRRNQPSVWKLVEIVERGAIG